MLMSVGFPGRNRASVVDENRPFLIILQSENDQATGQFFPIGTGLFNVVNLRAHWDRVPVPGSHGQKFLKGNSIPTRPAIISTWSTTKSFHLEKPRRRLDLIAKDEQAFDANV